MKLHHYCAEPGKDFFVSPASPSDNPQDICDRCTGRIHKPGGLWLSDDSDQGGWPGLVLRMLCSGRRDWIEDKDELLESLRYGYEFEIDLRRSDRVLRLNTRSGLQWFTQKYGEESPRPCNDGKPGYGLHIEWERVKAEYMGILITPFQRGLARKDPRFHWYGGWDCASGCFWDTTCLTQIGEAVKTPPPRV